MQRELLNRLDYRKLMRKLPAGSPACMFFMVGAQFAPDAIDVNVPWGYDVLVAELKKDQKPSSAYASNR